MGTTPRTSAPTEPPTPVQHHWIMTVQFDHGRRTATYDGSVGVTPGVHTRTSTYTNLREHIQRTVGSDQLIVLFFSLTPDSL
jgi:hypothetical protein